MFRQIIDGVPQKELVLLDKDNYENYRKEVSENDNYKMKNYCDTIDEKWIVQRIL